MIVWLASYPRSGNTLTRQLFKQMFGLETHSRYNDSMDIGAIPEVADAVGHRNYQGDWQDFYTQADQSAQLTLIKTHDPPNDDRRTIYIVRNGRAAVVSFCHFLRDFRKRIDIDMREVIEGRVPYGSWSQHLEAWQPLLRPDTLLVRFEDLLAEPDASAQRIGTFLGVAPTCAWRNELANLRQAYPGFFRDGDDTKNIAELTPDMDALFQLRHGVWSRRLGYSS